MRRTWRRRCGTRRTALDSRRVGSTRHSTAEYGAQGLVGSLGAKTEEYPNYSCGAGPDMLVKALKSEAPVRGAQGGSVGCEVGE
jgi:hypothetical protein